MLATLIDQFALLQNATCQSIIFLCMRDKNILCSRLQVHLENKVLGNIYFDRLNGEIRVGLARELEILANW